MPNPFSSRRVLTVAGSLAAIVSIAAIAQAATDTLYKYTTPKTGVWHVTGPSMTPASSNIAYQTLLQEGALQVTANDGCFTATPDLPNGAKIVSIIGTWNTPDVNNSAFGLYRFPVGNGAIQMVGEKNIPITNGRQSLTAPVNEANAVVNNNQFFYLVAACLNSTQDKFYGIRIGYTYTHAGD